MYQSIHRFFTAPNIIWGSDSVRECLTSEIKAIGIKRVMLITDKTIAQVGIAGTVESYLKKGNIEYCIYDDAESEPAFDIIPIAFDAVKNANIDGLVALGGGSVIDLAKAVSVIFANGGDPLDYAGVGRVPKAGPPVIAIPTTAGTGSEVTPNAIFVHKEKQTKMGIVSPHILPRVAIVDPQMTMTAPPKITAATGMDALCHAIESYISIKASPLTDILSLQAIEYIGQNLRAAVKDGSNMEAREKMSTAALFAGITIANAGTNIVHALSYPLGGKYHIPHGLSNALMLPWGLEYNLDANPEKFAKVAETLGEEIVEPDIREESAHYRLLMDAAIKAIDAVKTLAEDIDIPIRLSAYNISEDDIPLLAKNAAEQTRLLTNNPKSLRKEEAEEIYRRAL